MTSILPLASQSQDTIDALLDEAFGTDRHGRTAYLIRRGTQWLPELSYAVVDNAGRLTGTLQSWPVALNSAEGAQSPLVMVGPVAVQPGAQNSGIGRLMMDRVVRDARAQACAPLMMIGDPEYYGRFWGFSADGTQGWRAPATVESRRLLALAVDGGVLPSDGMLGPRVLNTA